MNYDWIESYLLTKPGTRKDYKVEWGWDRYLIADKMYAAVCYNEAHQPVFITMKLDPTEGEALRGAFEDIIPGYYMNKLHWNSVKADGCVPDDLVRSMLDKSYELVMRSFSKKKQEEIRNGMG